MQIREHWRAVAGSLATLYGCGRFVLDVVGYVDSVTAHVTATSPTWLGKAGHFLMHPPDWVPLVAVFLGLALIWWDTKRHKPKQLEPVAPARRPGASEPPSAFPVFSEIARTTAPQEMRAVTSNKAPARKVAVPAIQPPTGQTIAGPVFSEHWEQEIDFHVLFRVDEDRRVVNIKFQPDSKEPRVDAILLILFGYKKFFGMAEVHNNRITEDLRAAPIFHPLWGISLAMFTNLETAKDIAREKLDGDVNIVGLSRGGMLAITASGYARAYGLACDMIARA
jgi:hypothetical protein